MLIGIPDCWRRQAQRVLYKWAHSIVKSERGEGALKREEEEEERQPKERKKKRTQVKKGRIKRW